MKIAGEDMNALVGAARAHADEQLLFLVAFDGVLAGYRSDSERVRLPPARRARLRRLQDLPDVTVGVVSGRRLRDLQERTALGAAAYYVGLHGLEVAGPRFLRVDHRAFEASGPLVEVATRLAPTLAGVAGVRIEIKEAVVALHTRDASSEDAVWSRFQLLNAAAPLVNAGAARFLRGHDALELLPTVGHAKARAITAIQHGLASRRHAAVFTIYVGDDAGDDDASGALGEGSVAAVVGRPRPRAEYRLRTAGAVDRFINALIADREASGRSRRPPRRDGALRMN